MLARGSVTGREGVPMGLLAHQKAPWRTHSCGPRSHSCERLDDFQHPCARTSACATSVFTGVGACVFPCRPVYTCLVNRRLQSGLTIFGYFTAIGLLFFGYRYLEYVANREPISPLEPFINELLT